jgi:hypothetical protein
MGMVFKTRRERDEFSRSSFYANQSPVSTFLSLLADLFRTLYTHFDRGRAPNQKGICWAYERDEPLEREEC